MRLGLGRKLTKPLALPPGSTVGICAPSGPVNATALEAGLSWLDRAGYKTRCATHLRDRSGFLAGGDEQRLADLLELVRAPEVRAIILARGGYGLGRLLARLDPREIRRTRKLFVGFSDATLLLLWLARCARLAGVHGPMLERNDTTPEAQERLLELLRGGSGWLVPLEGSRLKGGRTRGRLVGGNLTLLAGSLGTPWEVDTRGAILFLEEVGEEPYAIDRTLVQLREAGKLRAARGVAIGRLVDCASERYPDVTARHVVAEILKAEVEGPIVEDLPIGHVADNRALGFGIAAELDGNLGTLTLLGPVVEEGA